jgi:hypothetical protein
MKPSKKPARLSESVHQRLNMYALAASAAGVGCLALAQAAEAKIVYTPAHVKSSPLTNFPLDLNHDGITDFTLYDTSGFSGKDFNARLSVVPVRVNGIWGRQYSFASALPAGVRVGPHGPFASRSGQVMASYFHIVSTNTHAGYRGQWANSGKGIKNRYLGLKFQINSKDHFGWARLTVTVNKAHGPSFTGILTGYAYETIPNKPIITGKTREAGEMTNLGQPEATLGKPVRKPATLGLLAMGGPAVSIWRREGVSRCCTINAGELQVI